LNDLMHFPYGSGVQFAASEQPPSDEMAAPRLPEPVATLPTAGSAR
jgi:hypothetical protein